MAAADVLYEVMSLMVKWGPLSIKSDKSTDKSDEASKEDM